MSVHGLPVTGVFGSCRVPVFTTFGEVYATRDVGPHDWRLFERKEEFRNEFVPQEGAPGYGTVYVDTNGHREVWYCTRCRIVAERFVPS